MKESFKITEKEMQLLTVIILFLSLTISVWGNLEQIKQNKIALSRQGEYASLTEYKKDFVLCSEEFLSLLESPFQNNETYINKKDFENDLNLGHKLVREGSFWDGFLVKDHINDKDLRNLSAIMNFTFIGAKLKIKNDNVYQDYYTISREDLVASIQEANRSVARIVKSNHLNFKTNIYPTLEEYRSIYFPAIEKIHAQFDRILIDKF